MNVRTRSGWWTAVSAVVVAVLALVGCGGGSATRPDGGGAGGGAVIAGCTGATAFTQGIWDVYDSRDETGRDWSGSTLVFASATPAADGCAVDGHFDWRSSDGRTGMDLVRGSYHVATRALQMTTYSLTDPQGIVPADYRATYDPGRNQLIDGTWTCSCAPGIWTARHLVGTGAGGSTVAPR